MIIETIFSTVDENGNANFAPMGIEWGDAFVVVRPFRSSRTFRNMRSGGCGVANLSDNVLAFVKCALFDEVLPSFPSAVIKGVVFRDTCSWLELEANSETGSDDRAEFICRILHRGRQKDFLGFCRASNAVVEAAILATRLGVYNSERAENSLNQYMKVVEKTGSENEKLAFRLVMEYVERHGKND